MKRFLLYGHGGSYNHGAEAILKTTIEGIQSICPDSEILLSSHFPEQDKEFLVQPSKFLSHNMDYFSLEKAEKAQGLPTGRYDKLIYQTTIEELIPGTTTLSIGGDNYCYPVWHRWSCIHNEAKRNGVKDILWSCSVDPKHINAQMIDTLGSHHLITARESLTFEALKKAGLKNVELYADIAFLLNPIATDMSKQILETPSVAINISPLVIRRECKEGIVNESLNSLIDYILEKTDYNIVFVPHVTMPMDNDYVALSELYQPYANTKYANRIILCSDKLSAAEYKYIISKCQFGVFSRTHASIAAYSCGIPCLVLGYSIKAQGIAKDMGVPEYVLDISKLNQADQLVERFQHMLNNESDLKNILEENAIKTKTLANQMINRLADE